MQQKLIKAHPFNCLDNIASMTPMAETVKQRFDGFEREIFGNSATGSDWCGSVGGALSCRTKGRGCYSWSGHVPRLWFRSPFGCLFSRTLVFLSLSPSLPSPPSKRKYIKSFKNKTLPLKASSFGITNGRGKLYGTTFR